MQHAARDKAAREDEEETGVAADALPQGQSDRRSGGGMRGGVQGLEDPLPVGSFLYGTFPSGISGLKIPRGVVKSARTDHFASNTWERDDTRRKNSLERYAQERYFFLSFSFPNGIFLTTPIFPSQFR